MSEEMVVLILSRMSPKSLMRFKCVGKSWYSLITSPSFIAKHLSNSKHNKHCTSILCKRFVLRDINTDEKEAVYSLINFFNDNDGKVQRITHSVEDIDIPLSMGVTTKGQFNGVDILDAVGIRGHCDGIVCLADGDIVLWNPKIKEFKILPPPCLPDGTINSIGFGYDPKSKDYKVVSIAPNDEEEIGERVIVYPPKAEVYTLGSDSWSVIQTDYLETETSNFCPEVFQIYFKGICYWMGLEQQKEFMNCYDRGDEQWVRQVILLLEMSDEVFDHILLPNSLYNPATCNFSMRVIVWNDTVALFGLYHYGDPNAYGLWVLDNCDSVKGTWTKQLTLEVIRGTREVLEFWKNDEILMVATDGRIVSYNLITEKIKHLPIETMYPNNSEAVVCVDSIVPVIHGRQQT